jgi:hypothetical protein
MKKALVFTLLFLIRFHVSADFINLVQADKCESIIEIFVGENEIVAKLEIGEPDYQWFSDIIPVEYYRGGFTSADKDARWRRFMERQFILKSEKGILNGKVKFLDHRNRTSRSGIATGQVDSALLAQKIIYVEIAYSIPTKISTLTITPPMQQGYDTSLANIGFVVYHKTVPVNDLRILQQEETLVLSWEDPWYSYFRNPEISRHHKSSFMSFLYVEPYEVRHEILGRLKDFETWVDLRYGMDDVVGVEAQDSIREVIASFLVNKNPVKIDGVAGEPIIDRIHFVEANLTGIQVIETPKPLPFSSALVGVIFAYPYDGLPEEVSMEWELFTEQIQMVPATSIGPEGPWPYDLQPTDNIMNWKNFLKNYPLPAITEQKVEAATVHVPLFSIVFVFMLLFMLYRNNWRINGLSKFRKFLFVLYILLAVFAFQIGYKTYVPFLQKMTYTDPEAKELMTHLLKNTYRAFDFYRESDIYDKLAIAIDRDLLQQIYLQTRQSMTIENQGGIKAKVEEVLVTKVREAPSTGDGKAYRCEWIVRGEVGHWGHTHRRINQYDALISIRPVGGVWKMHDLDLIEERRL